MKIIFQNKILYRDLLGKALIMFGAAYVILFGLEVVLPGIIAGVFNLNFMLLMFFVALFLLIAFPPARDKNSKTPNKAARVFIWCFVLYLILILFFALYRVSIWESLLYLFLTFLVLKGFFKMIE